MKLDHISKSFGENTVLSDVSCEVDTGIYALLGESGKGKTTLLSILAGIIDPDCGSISDNIEPVYMVFQENRLVEELNALSNIKLINPKLKKDTMKDILRKLGIDDQEKKDIYKIPVNQFSGGMKRRVCLVSVLESKGKLLLLDEPFSGLDPMNKRKVMDYLLEKSLGRTIIFTTHDSSDVDYLHAKKIELV